MIKRIMLIGVLFFSVLVLLPAQVMAWNVPSGGWGWGSYEAWFNYRGGGNPHDDTRFFGTQIEPIEACLVCVNPGNNRKDVRLGFGGITITTFASVLNFVPDQNGNTTNTTELPSSVQDLIYDPELCYAWSPDPNAPPPVDCDEQATFEYVFQVGPEDCRNDNWLPWEYLIRSLYLTGNVVECTDPEDPTTCDPNPLAELRLYCETQESCRDDWSERPPGDPVVYICVEEGSPIAWDDSYSVRAGRTLRVKAPGVLGNDSDAEGNPLEAIRVHSATAGTLHLDSDGSFTYTPNPGTPVDTFTYRALDNSLGNLSNEATVHITVE